MFEGKDFPRSLDEEVFEGWLEKGRSSKIPYGYLLIIWNEQEAEYSPVYAETRQEFINYETYQNAVTNESLVAIYDLFSESRIYLAD